LATKSIVPKRGEEMIRNETAVFVVEDETIVSMEIQDRLLGLGYKVCGSAASGEEAIEKIKATNPDIVLMDIRIKGDIDGIQVAEHISKDMDLPFVFLTAHSDDATLERAKSTGPFGYLLKPFEERVLNSTIEMALYRHQMDIKLRESERWFSTTLKSIGDAVIATDKNAKVTFMNSVAEKMTGWIEKDVKQKPLTKVITIVNEQTGKVEENPAIKALRDNEIVEFSNHRILKTKDGQKIPIEDSGAPIKDERGNVMGVVLIFRDVSERRKAEAKRNELIEQLEATNKELQDFAYVASHDLQEPLRKVQAFGDRLKDKYYLELGDQGQDYLNRMQNATSRMQKLIVDLLSYSRVTTKARPFIETNLSKIIGGVLTDLQIRIEEVNGDVQISELPIIDADPLQMQQLFQNLIGNALKFHKPDKMPLIKIYASNGTALKAAGNNGVSNGFTKIMVEDNGIGFDEKYLDRIFTVFQRLHGRNEYEGTGVGLAICRKIVERHGGNITAKSKKEQGAKFIITLPKKHKGGPNE
jgi:PAS domain S-box-containing protein